MIKKKILAAGTFDLLHPGHKFFLKQAAELGESLFVIIARDISVKRIKNLVPEENENIRLEKISSLDCVTQAFLGNTNKEDMLKIPLEIQPDIIALGYDQNIPIGLVEALPNTKIIRIGSHFPEKFKSSFFRKKS